MLGDLLFASGQIAIDPKKGEIVGRRNQSSSHSGNGKC